VDIRRANRPSPRSNLVRQPARHSPRRALLWKDADGPAAVKVRAHARGRLDGFEAIEGRLPNGTDIAAIVEREVQRGPEGPSAERLDAKDKAAELQLAGDNQRENKQARDIAVKLKLTRDQAQELHRAISGQGMSYQEVLQIAIDMFNK